MNVLGILYIRLHRKAGKATGKRAVSDATIRWVGGGREGDDIKTGLCSCKTAAQRHRVEHRETPSHPYITQAEARQGSEATGSCKVIRTGSCKAIGTGDRVL